MESWAEPVVPRLPGAPPTLKLWDTAAQGLREVEAGPVATMYVCGITPYDATHLGHALTYVTFDTLVRVWKDAGKDVRYAQNVTDVDEPLFERAERDGVDWRDLGSEQIQLFRDDMTALRCVPPTAYIGAMEAMPQIVMLLDRLDAAGNVYEVDGDFYADTAVLPRRGALSHLAHDEMVALARERGGDPDRPGKRDPVDPIVWRGPVEGEPSWPSSHGPGRPGWHIECAAIALEHLGETIDVQGGGVDLVFPHHEFGILHAEVATGLEPFARANVHVEHLAYDGHKMSKSRGNLVFVSKLLAAGVESAAIRLALHAHHHREGWEWTEAALEDANERLRQWRTAADLAEQAVVVDAAPKPWVGGASGTPDVPAPGSDGPAADLLAELRAALANDLDTPAALAVIDRWAEATLSGGPLDADTAAVVRTAADALLGVLV